MKQATILCGIITLLFVSLGQAQTVTYEESLQDFPNPERGFYRPLSSSFSDNLNPLNANLLVDNRTNFYTPFSANYEIKNTLVFRYYVLDNFRDSNISSEYLDNIRNDMATIREAGVKVIMRFAYDISADGGDGCPSSVACPPYGDASKQRIIDHIAQLKPLFEQNYDVIAVVQMGFIGIWGEQFYTDFFGDISQNTSQDRLLDNNWRDRLEVLDALLAAVPESRMVQVRYPQIKQKAVYGIDAPVTSAAISTAQAHTGTQRARIGFHNDCFLASADDIGTYFDYGTSDTGARLAIDELKSYFAEDSRYTVVGGETCSDGFSPQNDCDGIAVADMRRLHYSYLNSGYNNDVNNDWQTGGCIDEIKRNLGYRLVMDQGTYASQATQGGSMDFSLTLRNVGFAAPYNPRPVELVLRSTTSGSTYTIPFSGDNADPRFWLPEGNITLAESLILPTNVPAGDYELLISLPDTSNNNIIANRPEYAIQLANKDTWEPATGYNRLNHTLTVGTGSTSSNTIGEVGELTFDQADATQWRTLNLAGTYTNPVVIMGPPSFNGAQSTTVRVRNVTRSSFQYQIDEWDYLDGAHKAETVSYLVVEAGTHDLGDGQILVAGTKLVGTGFANIRHDRLAQPVVFTQVTSVNEDAAVTTRIRNVGADSFQVRLQEEEGAPKGGSHAAETVAWVAISSGSGDAGRAFAALQTDAAYSQDFRSLTFDNTYSDPIFLANIQSFNGTDPVALRYTGLSPNSVSLKAEEETSLDSETKHLPESVSALIFAGSGFITARSSNARLAPAPSAQQQRSAVAGEDEELHVFPNPGRDQVTITYRQTHSEPVQLEVYDLNGRLEKTLVSPGTEGQHSVPLDANALGNGVHIIRLKSDERVVTRKLVVRHE